MSPRLPTPSTAAAITRVARLPVNPTRSEGMPRSRVIAGRFNDRSVGSTASTTNGIEVARTIMKVENVHLGCACASDVMRFSLSPSSTLSCRYATRPSSPPAAVRTIPSNFGGNSIAHLAFVLWCRRLEPEGQQEREQRYDPEPRRRGLHTNVPGLGVDAHGLLLDPRRYSLERILYLGVAHCLGGTFERRLESVFLGVTQVRALLELRSSHGDEHPDEHRPGHRCTEGGPKVAHAAREAGDITRQFGGCRRLHKVLDDREDYTDPQAGENEARGEAELRRRNYKATRQNKATDAQRKEPAPYEAALRNPPSA